MLSTPPTICQRQAAGAEHSGRLEHTDYAGAALHDCREGWNMRIKLGVQPHLAREIGVSEINRHRAPHGEIDLAVRPLRHRLRHQDRQGQ